MMKRIIYLILILLSITNHLHSQIYPVPNAEVLPSWVFPIWFEDGNGDKDTIYFCYDHNATNSFPNTDTLFGEKWVKKDSTKFWVGIWTTEGDDSTFQTHVNTQPFAQIFFHKGKYPLKISWDDTLLYSSSLPYPNLNPFPSARISIVCSDAFGNCPSDIDLNITAESSDYIFPLIDSVLFYGLSEYYIGNTLGEFSA